MLIPKSVCEVAHITGVKTGRSRYDFEGVRFYRKPSGVPEAQATDGRRLVLVSWAEDDSKDYPVIRGLSAKAKPGSDTIVPYRTLKEAQKLPIGSSLKPILQNLVLVEGGNGTVTIGATDLETIRRLDAKAIEGSFPAFADVVSGHKQRKVLKFKMSAGLLADTLLTLARVAPDAHEGLNACAVEIEVPIDEPGAAVKITRKNDKVYAEAYQMPVVDED